jgi:hypothetical protein
MTLQGEVLPNEFEFSNEQQPGAVTHSSCSNAAGAMINGNDGWCSAAAGVAWMIIDAGAGRPIAGVAMQGRSDADQWVTQFGIATSTH